MLFDLSILCRNLSNTEVNNQNKQGMLKFQIHCFRKFNYVSGVMAFLSLSQWQRDVLYLINVDINHSISAKFQIQRMVTLVKEMKNMTLLRLWRLEARKITKVARGITMPLSINLEPKVNFLILCQGDRNK